MKKLLPLFCFFAALPLQAQTTRPAPPRTIAQATESPLTYRSGCNTLQVSIAKRADYVMLRFNLENKKDSKDLRNNHIADSFRSILKAAEKKQLVLLGLNALVLLPDDIPQDYGEKSFFSFSSKSGSNIYYLAMPLAEDKSVSETMDMLHSFLAGIPLKGRTVLKTYDFKLGLDNPEQYRERLIRDVSARLLAIRDSFGPGSKLSITGLSAPLSVKEYTDDCVLISLDYSFTVNTGPASASEH